MPKFLNGLLRRGSTQAQAFLGIHFSLKQQISYQISASDIKLILLFCIWSSFNIQRDSRNFSKQPAFNFQKCFLMTLVWIRTRVRMFALDNKEPGIEFRNTVSGSRSTSTEGTNEILPWKITLHFMSGNEYVLEQQYCDIVFFSGQQSLLITAPRRRNFTPAFCHNCSLRLSLILQLFTSCVVWYDSFIEQKPQVRLVRNPIYVNIEWQIFWRWCTQKIIHEFLSWGFHWIKDEKSIDLKVEWTNVEEERKNAISWKHKL